MKGVTLADVFRVYIKPSLDGRIVFRKKTSKQTSARLLERKMKVAKAKPAQEAYENCKRNGDTVMKRVYIPGKGYETKEVCPIDKFRTYLRQAMSEVK